MTKANEATLEDATETTKANCCTGTPNKTQKVVTIGVAAAVGTVALPFLMSAAALSTIAVGAIAGTAVGVSYLAGRNRKETS